LYSPILYQKGLCSSKKRSLNEEGWKKIGRSFCFNQDQKLGVKLSTTGCYHWWIFFSSSFLMWSFRLKVWTLGPLHVLWQVSFGCWVTWSISSWQKYYKIVFFSQSWFWMIKFTFIPIKLFGTWQFDKIDVLVDFIIQNWQDWKVNIFLSFSGER
jgi:hypothetical protein